jgi:hypothetical protein
MPNRFADILTLTTLCNADACHGFPDMTMPGQRTEPQSQPCHGHQDVPWNMRLRMRQSKRQYQTDARHERRT